ncbi:MAG: NADH-quinone oxidoreductase subunit C [Prevotellaceae bacterium]|nr:NADH-quinone oxidoreductase subunit C [Prevotellaceae bacterium]
MKTHNNTPVAIDEMPLLPKEAFLSSVSDSLKADGARCIAYFAVERENGFTLYCGTANDLSGDIEIFAAETAREEKIASLTPLHAHLHVFEREMHERFGIGFEGHPWLKPLRYPADRFDRTQTYENYPFFGIDNEALHEVGVGPIHAGIIEPGHFRFICEGEKVIHLEIVLGYQHRGIEKMMRGKPDLGKMLTAETIAGDSVAAHALAYVSGMEALAGFRPDAALMAERSLALELERIAIHIGDTAALCTDTGYQLGQVACEALRTIVINTTQLWCGNRFAKGLLRPCGTYYPLDGELRTKICDNLTEVADRYNDIASKLLSLPSLLARFEDVGVLTERQATLAGQTGLSARASGLRRDIRASHPFQSHIGAARETMVEKRGDVLSRLKQRIAEVRQSRALADEFLWTSEQAETAPLTPEYSPALKPGQLCFSLVEGWRGEVCHTTITDKSGNISHCKIKDPSLHNWFGLALAMRNQDISDFPICNKSFNLSYCGFDL